MFHSKLPNGGKQRSYVTEVEPGRPASGERPAQGPVYRSTDYTKMNMPEGKTLYDNWMDCVAKFADKPCIGKRVGEKYEYLTFRETAELATAVAGGMVHAGLKPHGRCCVFGANCEEWQITMQACNQQTIYCVPLYDSLGDNTVEYIIDHSESTIVFVSSAKVHVLAKALPKTKAGQVANVVYWGPLGDKAGPALEDIRKLGVTTHSFDDFVALGRQHPTAPVPPKPEDLCTIMYTSGTTGTPKGVLLTHKNVASEVHSFCYWFDSVNVYIGAGDVYLSHLPLAHIYDRVMEESFLLKGAAIAYWSGDVKQLVADVKACQPTIFCTVPRVYERMYDVVMGKVKKAGFMKRTLFNWAFNRKLHALKAGHTWDKAAPRLDKLVFKPVSKQMFGDRIRICSSGGGPMARHIEEFVRTTCCALFVQGYGLTETCAATFVDYPDEPDHFFSVGPPQPVVCMRLEAIPEMDYDPMGSPPRGEVLVRSEALCSGYYKQEEETRKAIDAEGWFHTGDVGEITPTGALRIIDRKKNIFKLSQGEYIAVEKIEGVLLQSPLVEQIWVHGSHFESVLVAVVVPSQAKLEAWAKEQGLQGDFKELCGTEQVKQHLLKEVDACGRKGGLKGFELPKALYVEDEAFSVENDLVTPTFKMRRPQLLKKYTQQVDKMYAAIKAKDAAAKK